MKQNALICNPITADDGTTKWVISEGGRYYRIGDLKKIDEHWTFVQDKDSDRYVMNFGLILMQQ